MTSRWDKLQLDKRESVCVRMCVYVCVCAYVCVFQRSES